MSEVDSSNNYIEVLSNPALNIESGDFTIECWINKIVAGKSHTILSNYDSVANRGYTLQIDATNQLIFQIYYPNSTPIVSVFKISDKRWNHIAITREGDMIRLFINGIINGNQSISNGSLSTKNLLIGKDYEGQTFTGYMNELRLTKGICRYTQSFSATYERFDNTDEHYDDVSLLIQFQGNVFSSVFVDISLSPKSITSHGSVYVSKNESIFGTTSVLFSGEGSITNIEILNKGYDYKALPLLQVISENGGGADLVAISSNIGRINKIKTLYPYIDTIVINPSIQINSITGSGADIRIKQSVIFKDDFTFKNSKGVLGLNCTLLDSKFFQQFSYQIESFISRNDYDNIVDNILHPIGFIRFSLMNIFYQHYMNINLSDNKYYILFENDGNDITAIDLFYSIDAALNKKSLLENDIKNELFTYHIEDFIDETIRFKLLILKLIRTGFLDSYLFNPIYNLHWYKEISDHRFRSWVNGFDWIKEDEIYSDKMYISQALDIYYIKYLRLFEMKNSLVNSPLNLEWYKNSELFTYHNEYYDNINLEQTHQQDKFMTEALDANIALII